MSPWKRKLKCKSGGLNKFRPVTPINALEDMSQWNAYLLLVGI
jgi:hypothetical protein